MSKSPFRSYKRFDKSRNLLRLMFIYGVHTKSELADLFSISESMIEKDIYWMDKLIGSNINNNEKTHNKSRYYIDYKYFEHTENYLTEAYLGKSSNKNRLPLFFFILNELNRCKQPLSQQELLGELGFRTSVTDKPFKKLLNDMIGWDLVDKKKVSKKFKYSLKPDLFESFSTNELQDIYNAVTFFSNIATFSVPGRFLKDTFKNYLNYKNMDVDSNEPYYLFRHRNFHPVLDEEIIWKLIPCINNNTKVELLYHSKLWDEPKTVLVSPVKLIHNNRYGRWYLIGSEDDESLYIYRIDNILSATALKDSMDYKKLEKLYYDNFDFSWVISPKNKAEKAKKVDMIFRATSPFHYNYLYAKVKREKKWGEIVKIDDLSFHLSIEVNDVNEMKPWIRGFGTYVEVLSSKEHHLREDLLNDWKEMLERYESI